MKFNDKDEFRICQSCGTLPISFVLREHGLVSDRMADERSKGTKGPRKTTVVTYNRSPPNGLPDTSSIFLTQTYKITLIICLAKFSSPKYLLAKNKT